MGKFIKSIDLIKAQKARFERIGSDAKKLHADIAQGGYNDYMELTGGEPTGKARLKMLREMGHPFGRGPSAAESTPTGARRGKVRRGAPELLPIGIISGRLRRSIRMIQTSSSPQSFKVGSVGAGGSTYVLLPGGTKRMVARGIEKEIKRRWKDRNKAFVEHMKRIQAQ